MSKSKSKNKRTALRSNATIKTLALDVRARSNRAEQTFSQLSEVARTCPPHAKDQASDRSLMAMRHARDLREIAEHLERIAGLAVAS